VQPPQPSLDHPQVQQESHIWVGATDAGDRPYCWIWAARVRSVSVAFRSGAAAVRPKRSGRGLTQLAVAGLFYAFGCIVSWTVPPLMFPTWNVSA